jgi:hypothetical protein
LSLPLIIAETVIWVGSLSLVAWFFTRRRPIPATTKQLPPYTRFEKVALISTSALLLGGAALALRGSGMITVYVDLLALFLMTLGWLSRARRTRSNRE